MTLKVGVIGLGKMGTAIAERLALKNFPVSAWTRSTVNTDWAEAHQITAHMQLSSIAADCEILLLSLSNDEAVSSVLEKLLDGELAGRLVVDCSTVSPTVLTGFAPRLRQAGANVLDAPISGWPMMAAKGQAGLYIGGADADVVKFRPVAEALSNRIHHVGPLGQGMAAKIVNNMMLTGYWQCLREAMQVGQNLGLTSEKMLEILTGSPAANGVLALKAPVILGADIPASFTVSGVVKDLTMFNQVADQLGVDTPAIQAALDSFSAHLSKGFDDADFVSMINASLKPSQAEVQDVL